MNNSKELSREISDVFNQLDLLRCEYKPATKKVLEKLFCGMKDEVQYKILLAEIERLAMLYDNIGIIIRILISGCFLAKAGAVDDDEFIDYNFTMQMLEKALKIEDSDNEP